MREQYRRARAQFVIASRRAFQSQFDMWGLLRPYMICVRVSSDMCRLRVRIKPLVTKLINNTDAFGERVQSSVGLRQT